MLFSRESSVVVRLEIDHRLRARIELDRERDLAQYGERKRCARHRHGGLWHGVLHRHRGGTLAARIHRHARRGALRVGAVGLIVTLVPLALLRNAAEQPEDSRRCAGSRRPRAAPSSCSRPGGGSGGIGGPHAAAAVRRARGLRRAVRVAHARRLHGGQRGPAGAHRFAGRPLRPAASARDLRAAERVGAALAAAVLRHAGAAMAAALPLGWDAICLLQPRCCAAWERNSPAPISRRRIRYLLWCTAWAASSARASAALCSTAGHSHGLPLLLSGAPLFLLAGLMLPARSAGQGDLGCA